MFSIDGVRTGGHCVYCREVVVAVPHRIGYHEAAILDKNVVHYSWDHHSESHPIWSYCHITSYPDPGQVDCII